MRCFIILDDTLYYSDPEGNVCRSNLDGTGAEEIFPGNFSHLHVLGSKIYMHNPNCRMRYWMNTNGSGFEEVTSMGKLGK